MKNEKTRNVLSPKLKAKWDKLKKQLTGKSPREIKVIYKAWKYHGCKNELPKTKPKKSFLTPELKKKWENELKNLKDKSKKEIGSFYITWLYRNSPEYRKWKIESLKPAKQKAKEIKIQKSALLKIKMEQGQKVYCENMMKCCGGKNKAVKVYSHEGAFCELGHKKYKEKAVERLKLRIESNEENKKAYLLRLNKAKKSKTREIPPSIR